jgi:hypothetical protein
MARMVADPQALIDRIDASKAHVEAGTILTSMPMSKAVGWSWVNLRKHIEEDPDFPVAKRGSEGVPYEFDAHAVFAHLILRATQEIEKRTVGRDRIARLSGIDSIAGIDALTVDELVKINGVQTSVQRRKIEQRDFVPRVEVETEISGIFTMLQTEILGRASQLDPAGQWPPEVRKAVEQSDRTLLVHLHDMVTHRMVNASRPATGTGV